LVVVNRLLGRLVVASIDRLLKVADVEDVSRGVVDEATDLACRRALLVELIELVIKEEDGHGLVDDPALVRVCVADVWGRADDRGVLLVGGVVDSQGVFVIAKANLLANVLRMRALVNDTLCVMNIAIASCGVKCTSQQIFSNIFWIVSLSFVPIQPGEVGLLGSDTSTMKRPPAHLVFRELAPLRPPTA
jgi:hypothetical protein